MNDHVNPDPDPDPDADPGVDHRAANDRGDADEMVSSVLDDEGTDDEIVAVNADPALSARLVTLRAVSDAHLAIAVDAARSGDEQVDRRIAAALDADRSSGVPADRTATTTTGGAPTLDGAPTVAPIRVDRPRRRGLAPILSAAAVVLVVAVAVVLAIRPNGGDTAETAGAPHAPNTTAAPLDEGAGDAAFDPSYRAGNPAGSSSAATSEKAAATPTSQPDEDATGSANPSGGSGAGVAPSMPDLGEFSSTTDLVAAALEAPDRSTSALPCPSPFPPSTTVRVSSARLQGREVLVVLGATSAAPAAASSVVLLERSSCARVS